MSQNLIPNKFTAGESLNLCINLTAYPAPDWSLSLYLRGPAAIDLTSTADNNLHKFTISAETTSSWQASSYWYELRATDDETVTVIEEGSLIIKPDLSDISAPYDGRHHVEKVLDAIEAVIESRATKDQERYRINNRELQRTPLGELIALRSKYRAELLQIKRAKKGQSLLGRKIYTVF